MTADRMTERERITVMGNEPATMTTYRPADPDRWITEWTWQTTLDWARDAAESGPVEVVEEVWERVSTRTFTVTEPCDEIGCTEPATHWGLCERHAREDDPEAFEEVPAACDGPTETGGSGE